MKLSEMLRKRSKVSISAKDVKSSRVIYESAEVQRVEIQITLPTDEILVLELTAQQTRELATELVSCLQAMGYEFRVRR
jgi:hypothetical protein